MTREIFNVNQKVILKNSYIKITNEKLLNYIVFDDKHIYKNGTDSLNRCLLENNTIDTTHNENCKGTYLLLLGQESIISAHFYEQFVSMYSDDFRQYKNNIIIYDTNDVFYNSFIDFITHYILEIDETKIIKIRKNILYKIENLIIYPINMNSDKNILNYGNFLNYFNCTIEKKKFYNIKFNTSSNTITPERSFRYSDEIIVILEKNHYTQLDVSSEYNKQIQLQNSEKIILTWGGNYYINFTFSLFVV
jgi:hypothetical protein